jgi:hypothetical protein
MTSFVTSPSLACALFLLFALAFNAGVSQAQLLPNGLCAPLTNVSIAALPLTISSNAPNITYPLGLNCAWRIVAPAGSCVSFEFVTFWTRNNIDFVSIIDDGNLLVRESGTSLVLPAS